MNRRAKSGRLDCHIRASDPADFLVLSALAVRSKSYWGYDEDFMSLCRAELSWSADDILAPTSNFQSCFIGDELVAFYALEFLDEQTAELEAIFIEPGFIGSGIGRLMIEHAKATAISRGTERIIIQGDPHAENFYLAMGARRRGSRESASISGRQLPLFELNLD